MPETLEVLIACNDQRHRPAIEGVVAEWGLEPLACTGSREAESLLSRRPVCMIICEERLPDGDYRALLTAVDRSGARVPVIILSSVGEWDEYLKAVRLGAFDMLSPPFTRDSFRLAVGNALRQYSTWNGTTTVGV